MKRIKSRREKISREDRELSDRLRDLVEQALRAGHRPGEVAAESGWSPAQVRIVARVAGLAPARPGRARPNGGQRD